MNQFVVIAKPGSGKTEAIVNTLIPLIETMNYQVDFISDRRILDTLVIADAAQGPENNEGWRMGRFSWVKFHPDGTPILRAMSGRLWNLAHDMMIDQMTRSTSRNSIQIYEFGIGPKIEFPDESLNQEAVQIFSSMRKAQIADSIAVIEIDTPLHIRLLNNEARPLQERMDNATFREYFPDLGEGSLEIAGVHGLTQYLKFKNDRQDLNWFNGKILTIFGDYVRPLIEGTNPSINEESMSGSWQYRR